MLPISGVAFTFVPNTVVTAPLCTPLPQAPGVPSVPRFCALLQLSFAGACANEREQQRDELIYNNGYQVLHVKEYQYKENPEKILNECLNYLTQ